MDRRCSSIDVEENTWNRWCTTANEVECSWWGDSAIPSDSDLGTRDVELCTSGRIHGEVGVSFVEGNNLSPKEIVSGSQARRQLEIVLSSIGNQLLNSPLAIREPIFSKLGPNRTTALRGAWNNLDSHRALVREDNNIIPSIVVKPLKGVTAGDSNARSDRFVVDIAIDCSRANILHRGVAARCQSHFIYFSLSKTQIHTLVGDGCNCFYHHPGKLH